MSLFLCRPGRRVPPERVVTPAVITDNSYTCSYVPCYQLIYMDGACRPVCVHRSSTCANWPDIAPVHLFVLSEGCVRPLSLTREDSKLPAASMVRHRTRARQSSRNAFTEIYTCEQTVQLQCNLHYNYSGWTITRMLIQSQAINGQIGLQRHKTGPNSGDRLRPPRPHLCRPDRLFYCACADITQAQWNSCALQT
ncbi:hypothetical protein J6590_004304 [Homalodisca vitripennis]|nr:hypothetical protein J6590_004304 [Homalodisca vitripennis]